MVRPRPLLRPRRRAGRRTAASARRGGAPEGAQWASSAAACCTSLTRPARPPQTKESCTAYASQFAAATGSAGLVLGFFKAHGGTSRVSSGGMQRGSGRPLCASPPPAAATLTASDAAAAQTSGAPKGSTAVNLLRAGKAMGGPAGLFAGLGFTYAAAECATEHYRGKADTVSGVVAGLATGGWRRRAPRCGAACSSAAAALDGR
jgi:hypothetical protein